MTTIKFLKPDGKETGAVMTLAAYFNVDDTDRPHTNQRKKPLNEFNAELKALSDDEKEELAMLAAEKLNYTLKPGAGADA